MNHALAHFEILAPDAPRLADWYASLFSWNVDSSNPYGYPLVSSGTPTMSGGFSTAQARCGTVLYFGEEDLHQRIGEAEAAGGRAETPVVEVDGIRLARFIDVCGNVSGLWNTAEPLALSDPIPEHPVVGFEIGGDQLLLSAFYRSVFSWNVDLRNGVILDDDQQVSGQIAESDRSFTAITVSVHDLDAFSSDNGDVLNPIDGELTWPDGRRQRRYRDPYGNVFGVVESISPSES